MLVTHLLSLRQLRAQAEALSAFCRRYVCNGLSSDPDQHLAESEAPQMRTNTSNHGDGSITVHEKGVRRSGRVQVSQVNEREEREVSA